jgi:hypothetical protein
MNIPELTALGAAPASDDQIHMVDVSDTSADASGTDKRMTPANLASVTVKVASANYTVGTTNPMELYGGIIYVDTAATITIPAVAAGASFTVITVGAVAVSVDPNAADLIVLDGVPLSDGDKVTNLSTAGDIAVFSYYGASGWYCSSNGWTDGN